jgi:hypothetical protein
MSPINHCDGAVFSPPVLDPIETEQVWLAEASHAVNVLHALGIAGEAAIAAASGLIRR